MSILGIILFIFNKIYFKTYLINDTNELLKFSYSLPEGEYDFKNGIVYSNSNVIYDKYFLDGNGKIFVDKYGNVKLLIESNNKCISKTSVGYIKISNGSCLKFDELKVELIRNNSKISFNTNKDNLEYKISSEDDFKGVWIKKDYTGNIIIESYREDDNYIWFKDEEGNISDAIKFSVNCLNTNKTNYKSDIFYCSGSTVIIDNIEWVVIEDTNSKIKLMKLTPIDNKLYNCSQEESNYCFYMNNKKSSYKWSNSFINFYLNNIYIDSLSEELKSKLSVNYICDDYDVFDCDKSSCGGYSKEEIEYYGYNCNNYIESKIKVISYDEFNYVFVKSKNKNVLNGRYWAINSYSKDKASVVQSDYEFYILENPTSIVDVKPVIVLEK